jgi:hypothetical protein
MGNLNGRHRIHYPQNELYIGEWQNHSACGKGKYMYENGIYYEGQWLNNTWHGHGRLVWRMNYHLNNNPVIRPDYEPSRRHRNYHSSSSNMSFPSSTEQELEGYDYYEGDFVEGKMHGKGKLFMNGNRYEGGMADNQMHGYGVCQYSNGDRYEGGYHYGQRHGRGRIVYNNGESYDGEWENGYMSGEDGVFQYASGARYVGMYIRFDTLCYGITLCFI